MSIDKLFWGGGGIKKFGMNNSVKVLTKISLSKMTFKYQILTVLTSASVFCKNKSWPFTQSVSRTRSLLNLLRRMSIHLEISNLHPQKISLTPVSWTGTKFTQIKEWTKWVEWKYAAETINVSYCLTENFRSTRRNL